MLRYKLHAALVGMWLHVWTNKTQTQNEYLSVEYNFFSALIAQNNFTIHLDLVAYYAIMFLMLASILFIYHALPVYSNWQKPIHL